MLRIVNNLITIAQRARCTDGDVFLWQTHQQQHGHEIFDVTVSVNKHILFTIVFQNFIYLHDNEMQKHKSDKMMTIINNLWYYSYLCRFSFTVFQKTFIKFSV